MDKVTAYKVFNPDWTCRGFQYEVGETYEEPYVELCHKGFHACSDLVECFKYYEFNPNNKVAVVTLEGKIDKMTGSNKIAATKITIVKEITWEEVLRLVNTGTHNTGRSNSGHKNSGSSNSGHNNSGNSNSGNSNSGKWNSGSWNSGSWNSGDHNSGDSNSGSWNPSSWNSGDRNSGKWNSGDRNSGDRNSGDHNSGSWNSGDHNSGSWNSGNYNVGYFSSTPVKTVRVFNKDTYITRWNAAEKPYFIYDLQLTEWVPLECIEPEVLEAHPEYKATNGYLKTYTYKEAWQNTWNQATARDKELLYNLPNFDPEVFKEITGIDVTE